MFSAVCSTACKRLRRMRKTGEGRKKNVKFSTATSKMLFLTQCTSPLTDTISFGSGSWRAHVQSVRVCKKKRISNDLCWPPKKQSWLKRSVNVSRIGSTKETDPVTEMVNDEYGMEVYASWLSWRGSDCHCMLVRTLLKSGNVSKPPKFAQ